MLVMNILIFATIISNVYTSDVLIEPIKIDLEIINSHQPLQHL